MKTYDIIVIGKGLIGSAAAKYLAASQPNIALIGPDEPEDYEHSLVFASHYDQARVQRMIGKDEAWTRLNTDSVQQYESIAAQSGIQFHQPVGCLYVNPEGQDAYLKQAPGFDLPFTYYSTGEAIHKAFPDYHFPESSHGLLEINPAGYINPRLLLKAQLSIAVNNGAAIYQETVVNAEFQDEVFTLITSQGNQYQAPRILLATGSFINFFNLLPRPLALSIKGEVILLARVNPATAERLAQLPSLLYEIDSGDTEGIYLIKPVQYPDGHYYLKMGCNLPEDTYCQSLAEVQNWFRNGNSERFRERLENALRAILPGVALEESFTRRCIINRTPHGRPYIGSTTRAGLYLAGGCNGYSAMCSDGIGRTAAHTMLTGILPPGYAPDAFEILYEQNQEPVEKREYQVEGLPN